jgi:glycosyltransferase involved in cell wall biosynthesis
MIMNRRILALGQYPPDIGGVASHVQALSTGLGQSGWDTTVIASGAAPVPPTTAVAVRRTPVPYSSAHFDTAYALQNLALYDEALDAAADGIDLIACHGSQHALAAMLLRDRTGAPLVYHAHNIHSAPAEPDGEFRQGLMHDIERSMIERCDSIIAISSYVDQLCARLGAEPGKSAVIPKGIPLEQFAGEWSPPREPVIAYVGRLSPEKGLETLFEALRLLRRHLPCRLLVAGAGEEDYVAILRAAVRELGLADAVWFLGAVGLDELPRLFQTASVTAVPSRMEALGRVALEAQASGCPVVVTDTGGLSTLVEDGVTGWKVLPGDTEALATALGDVIDRPEEAAKRAVLARAAVEQGYSLASIVDRTAEWYRQVSG